MSIKEGSVLLQIVDKLKNTSQEESQRNYASTIFTLTKSLETDVPSVEDFGKFIEDTHDLLIKGDSSKRCSVLRAVRYCLTSKDAVQLLLDREMHYAVVSSLEKDGDSAVERMQALKIIERVQLIAPELFPVGFARSLVAVANYKDDSFRKICIEALRDLSLTNPSLVAAVDGFTPMMDAVLEPITQSLADSIVLVIIYLLNDPATRAIVAYGVDLRALMSSFTDLDSSAADLAAKWRASKSAIVLLMRSWVGVVQLSAEEMAWPTLVRMLKDPKVPQATQEIILDTITEIFEPVMAKVKQSSAGPKLRAWQCGDDPLQQALSTGASTPLGHLHSPSGKNSLFYPGEVKSRPNSERIQLSTIAEEQRASGIGLRGGTGPVSQSGDLAMPAPTGTAAGKHHAQNTSKIESFFGATPVGTGHSAAKLESFFGATPTKSPSSKESGRSSFAWGGGGLQSSSTATAQELMSPPTATTSRKTFSMANFFSKDSSKSRNNTGTSSTTQAATTSGATTTASSGHVRRGSTGSQSSATGSAKDSAILFGKNPEDVNAPISGEMSTLMKIFNMRRRRGSKQRMFRSRPDSPGAESTGSLASSELRMAGYFNEQEALMDPIYNMMDNYKALLCSSFLHSNLIESLYFLGVNGANAIAQKSRRLMVNFLRIMAYIFPEDMCSELLTIPSLIEFAASVASSKTTKRAHKSTQILLSLAEAFTLMPYKQVCGNHISGLTLSPRQRPSIAATLSGGVASTASKGSIQSNNPSPAAIARANFPPLNIQTIFELAEEIKISTFSTISSGESTVDGTCSVVAGVGGASTAIEVLNNLRNNLTPEIDKNDFIKQMDLSKVIGKEGKEPFRWDWVAIGDMLEYSFSNPSRLSDALKTKWVRRISGFYRCSVEEKGYFANLDWEPIHLQYLECASNMYSVLLKDEAGMNFLTSDRRGMLFNEIAHEIENLTLAAGNTNITPQTCALQKNVFRLYSCQCTMSREFFTLLGRIVHNTGSKHLMSGTSVFANLLKLGQYRSLDYVSRLVLTSLSFTDGGIMSRQLMQQWTQKSGCTAELRAYAHTLLRILLRSGAGLEAFAWRIDAIATQLDCPRGLHTSSLYKALEEAVHDKSNLRAIIAKRPKLLDAPQAQKLLVRFLCIPEGIEYLSTDKNGERVTKDGSSEPTSWLSEELDSWRDRKNVEYVAEVDRSLTLAFAQCDNKIDVVTSDPVVQDAQGLDPIPIQTTEFLSDLVISSAGSSQLEDVPVTPTHSAVKLANSDNHGSGENNWYSRDPNSNLLVDLHGLVRVPWNIEVKVANSSSSVSSTMSGFSAFANGGTSGVGSTVIQQSPAGEYLRVDSFFDATYMPSPLCHEITSDAGNLVKVRGIVLDHRGFPTGHPIPYTKVVSCTLLAGVCPVTRTGRALPPGEVKTHRRRSTATEGAYEAVSRMSAMNTNTNSLAECPLPNSGNSYDLPVSYYLDAQYDWSSCKATHRQNHFTELPDGLFSVTVPGEPVVLIFSRRSPSNVASNNSTMTRMGRSGSIGMGGLASIQENVTKPPTGNAGRRTPSPSPVMPPPAPVDTGGGRDVARASGLVWLVEVQYIFRLETGNSIFVPMPTHIYGELTRTMEGCELIAKRKIVTDLLARAHQLYNVCATAASAVPVCVSPRAASAKQENNQRADTAAAVQDLQAAMWALGHAGSNELGCALILEADKKFLPWCIENVYTCPYYNLRGTFFHVLGLLSRTQQGSRRLLRYGWDSAPRNTHSAVAFPLRASSLFRSPGSFARPPQSPRSNQAGPGGNLFPFSSPPPLPPTPAELNTVTSQPLTAASAPTPPKSSVNSVAAGFGLTISTAPLAAASAATAAAMAGRTATSPNSHGGISPRRVNTIPDDVLSQLNVFNRSLAPVKNLEIEVLQLIAKLPGVIVYKECKGRLELIRRDHPSLFAQRSLYLQAHRMLESYTFKLTARRDVLALFADEAKMKPSPASN